MHEPNIMSQVVPNIVVIYIYMNRSSRGRTVGAVIHIKNQQSFSSHAFHIRLNLFIRRPTAPILDAIHSIPDLINQLLGCAEISTGWK